MAQRWNELGDYEQFRLENMIEVTATEEGLDPDLLMSVIKQESRWDQKAVSPKGATGLMQLMPDTAKELGVNPADEFDNLRGGARYLKQQMTRFKDPKLALAAYNAGPGAVKKYGGIPPYKETKGYVKNIMRDYEGKKKSLHASGLVTKDTVSAYEQFRNDALREVQPSGKPTSVHKNLRKELSDEEIINTTQYEEMHNQHLQNKALEEAKQTRPVTATTIAAQAPRGVSLALANLAGTPVDMASTVLGLVGINADSPIFGKEHLRDLLTVDALTPQNTAERIVSRTSEALGENLLMAFLPLVAGSKYGNSIAPLLRPKTKMVNGKLVATGEKLLGAKFSSEVIGKVSQSLVDLNKLMLANPAKFAILENSLALSGGISAALVEEVFPENKVIWGSIAEIVGTLGPVPLLNMMQKIGRTASRPIAELLPGDASARLNVSDELKKGTFDTPMYDRIRSEAQQAWDKAGMPTDPTIAQLTKQPGLIQKERMAAAQPEVGAQLKEREVLQNQRIRELSEELQGQWTRPDKMLPDVTDIKKPVQADLEAKTEGIRADIEYEQHRLTYEGEEAQKQLDRAFDDVSDTVKRLPYDKKDLAGAVVRKRLEEGKIRFHDEANQRYDDLNISGKWDISPLTMWKADFLAKATEAQKAGGLMPRSFIVLDAWSKKKIFKKGVSLDELTDLRTLLGDDIRAAKYGPNPNTKLSRSLGEFYNRVDTFIEEGIPAGVTPGQLDELRSVQRWYAENKDIYEKGVSASVLAKDRQYRPMMYDSQVIGSYIKNNDAPGQREAYQQFKAWAKGDTEVESAIRDYVLSDVLAVKSGDMFINKERAAAWLSQYDRVMKDFPNLKKEIFDLKKLNDDATAFAQASKTKVKEIQKKAANLYGQQDKQINQLMSEYGVLDFEGHNFVKRIVDSATPEKYLDDLLKKIGGDRTAKNGLKVLAWEEILSRTTRKKLDDVDFPLLSGDKMHEVLGNPKWKHFIQKVFSVEDIKRIQTIADVSRIMARSEYAPFRAGSDTAQNIWATMQTIVLQKFGRAVKMKTKYIVTNRLLKFISGFKAKQQVELLNEALLNPQVYDDLVSLSQKTNVSRADIKRLYGHIYVIDNGKQLDRDDLEEYFPVSIKLPMVRPAGALSKFKRR